MARKLKRGEAEIKAAMVQAQIAADRNAHKPDFRGVPLKVLFDKLHEEIDELYIAILSGNPQRILEEGGDVLWVVVMIMAHDAFLVWGEGQDERE